MAWGSWSKQRMKINRDNNAIRNERWGGEEHDYRIVGHPEEKNFQLVIGKTGGIIKVLGLYLRTLPKTEENHAGLVENGEGVAHHDYIYHVLPYSTAESNRLANLLEKKERQVMAKIPPKYETIRHPKKKTVNILLIKQHGRPILLLGRHVKTLQNTRANLRAVKNSGATHHKTETEIHVYNPMPPSEHKELAKWIRNGMK
ncbi:MAG: hypothetical protein V1811_00215 [Candidatus Micrarchaeota archaeon]